MYYNKSAFGYVNWKNAATQYEKPNNSEWLAMDIGGGQMVSDIAKDIASTNKKK